MNCPAGTAGLTGPIGTLASLALMVSVTFAAVFATETGVAVPTADGILGKVEGGVALAEVAAAICSCWCCRAWESRELTWRMSLRLSMRRLGKFSCRNCSSGRFSPLGVMGGLTVVEVAGRRGRIGKGSGIEVGRAAGRELMPVRTWERVVSIPVDVAGRVAGGGAGGGADCDEGAADATPVESLPTCTEA